MASHGHTIRREPDGRYRLRWWVWVFYTRRAHVDRCFERLTDEAGARRFAKRWDVEMPD